MVFDYYFLIVPLFVIFAPLNLIALKLSLKSNKIPLPKDNKQVPEQQQVTMLNAVAFMLKSRTLLQFCFVNRAKNKLPMLLALSLLGIINFIFPVLFAYCFIGTIVTAIYLTTQLVFVEQINTKQPVKPNPKSSVSYIIYGFISTIIFVSIAVWSFMNYSNPFLQKFLICFVANVGIDFFLVQPIVLLGLGVALSRIQRFRIYVSSENKALYLLSLQQQSEEQDLGAVGFSPRKKTHSPSKIPKIFANKRVHLDIQAQIKESQTFQIAMEMSKKIKKHRNQLPPIIAPLSSSMDLQESSKDKSKCNDPQTPINQMQKYSRDRTILEQRGDYLQTSQMELKGSGKLDKSALLNNRKLTQFANEQLPQTPNERQKSKTLDINTISVQRGQKNQQMDQNGVNRHTIQGENFFMNGKKQFSIMNQFNFDDQQPHDEDDETDSKYYRKKDTSIQNQRDKQNQKISLLKILENAEGEIQEIDGNSPEKRRKRLGPIKQQSMFDSERKKKPHRKTSSKQKRVIKFTSGSPYLQYLPKMLEKEYERNHKKSQPVVINKEDISTIQDKKRRKSVRKLKNTKQPLGIENNQNDCPEFVVEDF